MLLLTYLPGFANSLCKLTHPFAAETKSVNQKSPGVEWKQGDLQALSSSRRAAPNHREFKQCGAPQECASPLPRCFPSFVPSPQGRGGGTDPRWAGLSASLTAPAQGERIFPLPKPDLAGRGKRLSSFCLVGTALITPPCEERLLGFVHT